jgi:hypothetical protein
MLGNRFDPFANAYLDKPFIFNFCLVVVQEVLFVIDLILPECRCVSIQGAINVWLYGPEI